MFEHEPLKTVVGLAGVLLLAVVAIKLWSFVLIPRVIKNGIAIFLFGMIPIFYFRKKNILDVRTVPSVELLSFDYNPYRTISLPNRFVLIHVLIERNGWFKNIIITPKKPEEFCAQARSVLQLLPTHDFRKAGG